MLDQTSSHAAFWFNFPIYMVCVPPSLSPQTLKRKEKEYEHEMERLAREKIATQQRLAELKNELSQCMDVVEIDRVLRQTVQPEDDQASTSTASGTMRTPILATDTVHAPLVNYFISVGKRRNRSNYSSEMHIYMMI